MFDDVTNPKVLGRERRNRRILIGVVLSLLVAALLYWQFKNYRQERVAKRFLATLERQEYREAYDIWMSEESSVKSGVRQSKPLPSYRYQDFLRDWGPEGEYGKVERFEMTGSRSRGAGVIVTFRINGKEARIWVEKADKSLSFPPEDIQMPSF